ncbi:MAG: hypothetical protein N2B57_02590 [Planctomycetales bacterium]
MKRKFLLFLSCLIALPASRALAHHDAPDAANGVAETRIPQPPDDTHKSAIVVSSSTQLAKRGQLAKRLQTFSVDVTADIDPGVGRDNPSSFWDGKELRPVIYAPQPNGGAKIAWTDTEGTVHITPLDRRMRRCGVDMLLEGVLLRDLVAHNDGSAILTLQEGGMHLTRIRNQETIFKTRLISNSSREIHWGSLAWNGHTYGAYFALHGGGHEGDSLRFVDSDGEILKGGWNWGVSHSIDMRLVPSDDAFFPIALSDAYPGTGFYFNHNAKRISYTWGNFRGGTGGRIGGVVAVGDRLFMAFTSKEGDRKHWSVALADFAKEPPHKQQVHQYLEDAESDQTNVKIARYGKDRLLLSWVDSATEQRKFAIYTQQGQREGPAEILPATAAPRSDFKTLSGGSVAWAHVDEDGHRTLKIMRLIPQNIRLASFAE